MEVVTCFSILQGVRITNVQTLDTRYWRISELGQRLDTMSSIDYKVEERHRILFIRLAFVKLMPEAVDDLLAPPCPIKLSHHTFIPVMLSVTTDGCCGRSISQHEDLFTTLERVRSWVKASGRFDCTREEKHWSHFDHPCDC